MTILYVTYPGDESTRFDRDYYRSTHLPMVMDAWGPYGLETLAVFYPEGDGAGCIAICVCGFRDEAAVGASLAASETGRVMADVAHFTDSRPSQSRAVPL